jgi:nucleoside-diphosphate-sugar epimerase
MAVAVIGGAGFIGSNLVDELMVQGFEVTVLDSLLDGKVENLAKWRGHKKFEFIKGDARDRDLVRRVCDHKDWVYNLAAFNPQSRIRILRLRTISWPQLISSKLVDWGR